MSAVPPAHHPAPAADSPNEITIVSHSTLLYWWPVWAVGFLLGVLSLRGDHRMAIVPGKTDVKRNVSGELTVPTPQGKEVINVKGQDVLLMPEKESLDKEPTRLHISTSKNYGVLFAVVLLVVITITNIPLRGGWSFAIIVFAILLAIIFALADLWEKILETFSYLDIRINTGGYLFIASILFGIWLLTVLVFDRRIYMTFTPGQFKVCTEIGGGEKVYPTAGLALEKQRSDLFRHWILGLGSGDLIVKTTGAQVHEYPLHNVLFIGKKVKEIEKMLKTSVVVSGS